MKVGPETALVERYWRVPLREAKHGGLPPVTPDGIVTIEIRYDAFTVKIV